MFDPITYHRVTFKVPFAVAEIFVEALFDVCVAVSHFEDADHPDGPWIVEGFAADAYDRAEVDTVLRLAAAASGIKVPVPQFGVMAPRDWVSENLAGFPPIEVGRFFVHGSHFEQKIPAGKIGLQMDAGLAFGSGEHQTTKGCLLAIDRLARMRKFSAPLDMGCGSGILGLAAARLWRVPVVMSDIDPLSVTVCRRNARANAVHPLTTVLQSDGFANARIAKAGPYDLICANILARPLRAMAARIAGCLAEDGAVVLSGLLVGQEQFVLSAYREVGLHLKQRIRVENWLALVVD